MCGVPYHAGDGYIARLVKKGHRVAICEQVEDPRKAKGVVRREVVRVVSPGTLADASYLDAREPAFLMAIVLPPARIQADAAADRVAAVRRGAARPVDRRSSAPPEYRGPDGLRPCRRDRRADGRARCVVAARQTSAVTVKDLPRDRACPSDRSIEAGHFDARDCAPRPASSSSCASTARSMASASSGAPAADQRAAGRAAPLPARHAEGRPRARRASISLQDIGRLPARRSDQRSRTSRWSTGSEGGAQDRCLHEIDRTVTADGRPAAARVAAAPALVPLERIRDRLDAVEELAFRTHGAPAKLRETLRPVQDLERLRARDRARHGRSARPRRRCGHSLDACAARRARAARSVEAPLLRQPASRARRSAGRARMDRAGEPPDEPPALARDGGFTRDGVDAELDELRAHQPVGQAGHRGDGGAASARAPGSASLKVRFNRVFGYYIRDLEVEPARGAGRLSAQADDRGRRALHDAGA